MFNNVIKWHEETEVKLIKIEQEERKILEHLFFYYIFDMSEYIKGSLDDDGKYRYDSSNFDLHWV